MRRVFAFLAAGVALVLLTGASPPRALRRDRPIRPVAAAPLPTEESDVAPGPTPRPPQGVRGPCPADMRLVDGVACSDVEQRCLEWQPPPPVPGSPPRCARFAPNTDCRGTTAHARFCIDRFEWPNRAGALPTVNTSWVEASRLCASRGKRLCRGGEWTLACEGEERLPYPYGHVRDDQACNVDRPMLPPAARASERRGASPARPVDARVTSGAMERCVSPYGVHDLTGNVDEWVVNESGKPYASGLMGGYWGPVRDQCRAMTVAHAEKFSYYQIGFRCCADAPGSQTRERSEKTEK